MVHQPAGRGNQDVQGAPQGLELVAVGHAAHHGGHAQAAHVAAVVGGGLGHLHGQRIDSVVDHLCDLAARQRERVIAEVRVAAPLDAEQSRRLSDALSRLKGRIVRLNVAIDPAVLGGVHVKVGDEVIDGTVAAKLEQARRVVLG